MALLLTLLPPQGSKTLERLIADEPVVLGDKDTADNDDHLYQMIRSGLAERDPRAGRPPNAVRLTDFGRRTAEALTAVRSGLAQRPIPTDAEIHREIWSALSPRAIRTLMWCQALGTASADESCSTSLTRWRPSWSRSGSWSNCGSRSRADP